MLEGGAEESIFLGFVIFLNWRALALWTLAVPYLPWVCLRALLISGALQSPRYLRCAAEPRKVKRPVAFLHRRCPRLLGARSATSVTGNGEGNAERGWGLGADIR